MKVINNFENEYFFLSNFYRCPVYYDDIQYASSETAYQSQKTLDKELRRQIAKLTPREIWEGTPPRSNKYSFEQRADWEKVKNQLIYEIVLAKFSQNSELRESLLATKDAILIEGTTWHDNYWGNCTCEKCKYVKGFNQLGKTLMRVRAELGGAEYNEKWMNDYIGIKHEIYALEQLQHSIKPPCCN